MITVIFLEHRKRKPKVADHPEYHVSKYHDGNDITYHVTHRKTKKPLGHLEGYYNREDRAFHVEMVRAHGAGYAQSKEAESARKSGKHFLPKDAVHHVLKHVKKDFPGALHIHASRISGANPGRGMATPLKKPTAKEAKFRSQASSDKGRTQRDRHQTVTTARDYQSVTTPHPSKSSPYHAVTKVATTKQGVSWKAIRSHLSALKSAGIKSTSVETFGKVRHVALDRKKKGTLVFKKVNNGLVHVNHTKHGPIAKVYTASQSNGTSFTVSPQQNDSKAASKIQSSSMASRRVYRAIAKKFGATGPGKNNYRDRLHPIHGYQEKKLGKPK